MKHTRNRKNSNVRELKGSSGKIARNRTFSINKVLVSNQIAKYKELDKAITKY